MSSLREMVSFTNAQVVPQLRDALRWRTGFDRLAQTA